MTQLADKFAILKNEIFMPRKNGAAFFVFEGLDGSGQTTQANLLKRELNRRGLDVLLTKEPTLTSRAGAEIAEILSQKKTLSPEELQKLFAEDRREHLEKTIIPALRDGRIVISDRYFFSSFAFGGVDCGLERLIAINGDFLLPDAAFILFVRPETAVERIKIRGKPETLFENLEKLRRVAENYKNLAGRFRNLFSIDGEKPIGDVHRSVMDKIKEVLELD